MLNGSLVEWDDSHLFVSGVANDMAEVSLGLERRMTEPLASLEKENFRPSNTIYLASNQDNMGNMLLINKIITKIGRFRAVFRNI